MTEKLAGERHNRLHEVYQQFEGKVNVLEGKVGDAISQLDVRLNAVEKIVTKVVTQVDA